MISEFFLCLSVIITNLRAVSSDIHAHSIGFANGNIPGTVLVYLCPLQGLKEIAGWHDMRALNPITGRHKILIESWWHLKHYPYRDNLTFEKAPHDWLWKSTCKWRDRSFLISIVFISIGQKYVHIPILHPHVIIESLITNIMSM